MKKMKRHDVVYKYLKCILMIVLVYTSDWPAIIGGNSCLVQGKEVLSPPSIQKKKSERRRLDRREMKKEDDVECTSQVESSPPVSIL